MSTKTYAERVEDARRSYMGDAAKAIASELRSLGFDTRVYRRDGDVYIECVPTRQTSLACEYTQEVSALIRLYWIPNVLGIEIWMDTVTPEEGAPSDDMLVAIPGTPESAARQFRGWFFGLLDGDEE